MVELAQLYISFFPVTASVVYILLSSFLPQMLYISFLLQVQPNFALRCIYTSLDRNYVSRRCICPSFIWFITLLHIP